MIRRKYKESQWKRSYEIVKSFESLGVRVKEKKIGKRE